MSIQPPPRMVCHYCGLEIGSDKAMQAKTGNAWAHFTCWYDGGPFERERREWVAGALAGTDGKP